MERTVHGCDGREQGGLDARGLACRGACMQLQRILASSQLHLGFRACSSLDAVHDGWSFHSCRAYLGRQYPA